MPSTLFNDALLIDCTGADPRPHASVLVDDGRIARVDGAGSIPTPDGARVIDCGGMAILPGLTDAHVHFGLTAEGANPPPESHVAYVLKVVENIRLALDEGFTTVRDAGGLDPAYALAVAEGQIAGPRILPSGSFISITGGHGDQRPRFDDTPRASIPGLVAHTEIVDGADAVRAAARRQLRRGATQVKLMVSGGVMSPNDPLESLQFTVDEIGAAVQEARAFGTYVLAHCHTSAAMRNALAGGVRSIEHGSLLDDETAKQIASAGAFLVPTMVILEILARADRIPEFSRRKLEMVRGETSNSLRVAMAAGVNVGSGSDLLGPRQSRRASEIAWKARHMGGMPALISATRTNAELFNLGDRIGTIEVGKEADVVLVAGDPVSEPDCLVDARNIRVVMKGGTVCKDLTDR